LKIYENLDVEDLKGEIWKIVEEFPDYSVSNFGRIKRIIPDRMNRKCKIIKQNKNKDGYFQITLCKNKMHISKFIHILVFETFNNYKLKSDDCIHHVDENYRNNFLNNLKLMSRSSHSKFHYRFIEETLNHKLSNEEVNDIRKSLKLKLYTPKQLSWMFDISISQIYKIKNNRCWSHI
jgi:hypothetical protein